MALSKIQATWSEFAAIVKSPITSIVSLLGVVGGLITLMGTELFSENIRIAISVVLVAAAIIILSIAAYRTHEDEVTLHVHVKKKGEISIRTKGIANILQDVEREARMEGKSLDSIYCIVPANVHFDLDRLSEGSAMTDIWGLLASQKDCNRESQEPLAQSNGVDIGKINDSGIIKIFQKRVEKELKAKYPRYYRQSIKARTFPYGTCLKMNTETSAGMKGFNLLFVVNSDPKGLDRLTGKHVPESIEGKHTIDVMPYAFKEIAKHPIDTLIVPTIGTRYLGESVQAVVSSIVNRYIASLESTKGSYKLIISLTPDNIKKDNPSLNEIRRFARAVTEFYKV